MQMKEDEFIKEIYAMLSARRVVLTFLGEISANMVNALLTTLKPDINTVGDEIVVKKKVYKIIVECLENICRHSEVDEHNKLLPSIFLIGKSETCYEIVTGNYVQDKQAEIIKEKVEKINTLDRENIKKKHLEILGENRLSDKGGAGLGMIDIALKSGNKLECQFLPVENSTLLFYILRVNVVLS